MFWNLQCYPYQKIHKKDDQPISPRSNRFLSCHVKSSIPASQKDILASPVPFHGAKPSKIQKTLCWKLLMVSQLSPECCFLNLAILLIFKDKISLQPCWIFFISTEYEKYQQMQHLYINSIC